MTRTRTTSQPTEGSAYRAKVRLTDKAGNVLAAPGESCSKVPSVSLEWLLEQGLIERAPVMKPSMTTAPAVVNEED